MPVYIKKYNYGMLMDILKSNFTPIQCLPLTDIDETQNVSMLSSQPFYFCNRLI